MLLCAEHILPVTTASLRKGAILVRDGLIKDIGPAADLLARYPQEPVRDFGRAALLPGFINTHIRLEDSVFRGYIGDAPYVDWVLSMLDMATVMQDGDWYESSLLGGLEAIASGTTCVADTSLSGKACRAIQDLGLRGIAFQEISAIEKNQIDPAMQHAEESILEWYDFIDAGRIGVGVAMASMYSCHPAIYARAARFAMDNNLAVSLHLAGSREVFDFVRYGSSPFAIHKMPKRLGALANPPWLPTGVSPVQYALNWDAFEAPNTIARHCVYVDNRDIQTLKAHNVGIVVCPHFNSQLGMGVAPMNEFLRADLRVGLGTDSTTATDSSDLFQELRLAMLLSRATNPGEFLRASTFLRMVTIDAAAVLGMDDRVGSLEVGKCADIIAVDFSDLHVSSEAGPGEIIVNTRNASHVVMTMVGGNVVYDMTGWHVDADIDQNAVRVEEIRQKLKNRR